MNHRAEASCQPGDLSNNGKPNEAGCSQGLRISDNTAHEKPTSVMRRHPSPGENQPGSLDDTTRRSRWSTSIVHAERERRTRIPDPEGVHDSRRRLRRRLQTLPRSKTRGSGDAGQRRSVSRTGTSQVRRQLVLAIRRDSSPVPVHTHRSSAPSTAMVLSFLFLLPDGIRWVSPNALRRFSELSSVPVYSRTSSPASSLSPSSSP